MNDVKEHFFFPRLLEPIIIAYNMPQILMPVNN